MKSGRCDRDVDSSKLDALRSASQRSMYSSRRAVMQARMKHPALVVNGAMPALLGLGSAVATSAVENGVPLRTLNLAYVRASQINGCSVCLAMHARDAQKEGDTLERLVAVGAWRESPQFTDAERAALELTEAMTRQADRGDTVSDEIWDEAAEHYGEEGLAALVVAIGMINLWNRLNAATRQVAEELVVAAA
jgi:AhpD family alkylhydroperoxidase